MSISVSFYKTTSENNRLDKVLEVTASSYNCDFKGEVSIIDPVLLLAYNDDATFRKFRDTNYIFMQTPIARYFFVKEVRVIRQGLLEMSCHLDVLSTYRTAIRNNTAIILRQETQYNLYLNDGAFKVYQNPMILTREFPQGFTTQSYVMAVAGQY